MWCTRPHTSSLVLQTHLETFYFMFRGGEVCRTVLEFHLPPHFKQCCSYESSRQISDSKTSSKERKQVKHSDQKLNVLPLWLKRGVKRHHTWTVNHRETLQCRQYQVNWEEEEEKIPSLAIHYICLQYAVTRFKCHTFTTAQFITQ